MKKYLNVRLTPCLRGNGLGAISMPHTTSSLARPCFNSLSRAKRMDRLACHPTMLRDYAFDKRMFGAAQIRAQIDAAQSAGSDGWML